MANEQGVRFKITFMDESEVIFTSDMSQLKFAMADFIAKQYLEIDGKHYSKDAIFFWELIDAKKER